ncbi:MAG: hypothetical protein IJE07_09380 [Clostridia bacterium]|nr:hypothetical protein [Clostridia bacterium]
MENWHDMTAAQQLAALRQGRVTAEALTQHYLRRIRRYRSLNAVAEIDPTALEQARAIDAAGDRTLPLFGLPILVKDNIDVQGLHTTAGSLALADNVAAQDAPVIASLRRNGAVILGKTNMTEFANWVTPGMPGGYSARGGQVVHPYDRKRDPSGSSTGSAVAVAAGLCAAAIGTDTSFSIVVCAGEHGAAGFKAAHGALPLQGIVPICGTMDMPGPIARNMTDALLVYRGMGGLTEAQPTPAHRLRIAVNTANREHADPARLAAGERLLTRLQAAGAQVSEISQPPVMQQITIMRCEFRRDLEAYLAGSSAGMKTLGEIVAHYEADPARRKYGMTHMTDSLAASPEDAAYVEALAERARLREVILAELAGYDAVLLTGPTNVMHFTGLPSLTVPLCMDGGLPKGAILYGADEARLLSAALTIEGLGEGVEPPRLQRLR